MENLAKQPIINPLAFIHPSSKIIGLVVIEECCIVAPQVSLRADEGSPFHFCKGTNIQDGVTVHGLLDRFVEVDGKQYSVFVGPHCSLAHGALIHGPTYIGKKTFVGFNAIVHNSKIGRNCHIGHGAILDGVTLPDYTKVPNGMSIDSQEQVENLPSAKEVNNFNHEVVDFNKKLAEHYKAFYATNS